MAVPKRKVSKARRDKRRSNVWKLGNPAMIECPNCHELTAPHKICANCGFYKGAEVLKDGKLIKATVKKADTKAEKKAETATDAE